MTTTTNPTFEEPPTIPTPRDGDTRLVDGVEVVAIEQAMGHAPNPVNNGKLVPFQNVAKALLADGREVYLCDGPESCDYYADTVKTVTSHRSAAHRDRGEFGSNYPVETLRAVMRAVLVAKRTGVRNWAQVAAEALNAGGFLTTHRKPWTAGAISNLYRQYGSLVKVRMPSGRPPGVKNGAGKQATATVRNVSTPGLLVEVKELQVYIEHALVQVTNLRQFVEAGRFDQVVDPELVNKAAKWDQMQELMGRSG
jgi:hypothetical protein